MLIALLLQATPAPGELRTVRDWTVGCDNGRACQAVALLPQDGADGATLTVRRGAEAGAVPAIWVTVRSEDVPSPSALLIDGRRFTLRMDRGTDALLVQDAAAAARLLGQATRIEALVEEGARVTIPISSRGSAGALLYMDERQGRLGTTSALVRRGPNTRVPPPPLLPVIATPPASARAPRRLTAAGVRQLLGRDATVCDYAQSGPVETVRLDARSTLVLATHPCGNGAYNVSTSAFIVDERGQATPARFDAEVGVSPEAGAPDNVLIGADWMPETRRLSSFFKGRGPGDCGHAKSFAWDGARFRLAEASAMGECRGSTDYITTWRARVVPRR